MIDSFDGYVTSEIPTYWSDQALPGTNSFMNAPARTGVNAITPRPLGIVRNIGFVMTHAIVGVAFTTNTTAAEVIAFSQGVDNQNIQCMLIMSPDGTVAIQLGNNGAIQAHSDPSGPLLQQNVYHYVEWEARFTNPGEHKVWIDGELVLDASINGQNMPTPGASTIWLRGAGGGSNNLFDDFYLINPDDATGFTHALGDTSVICSISSANGDVNDFIPLPLTNPNWVNVHEIPADSGATINAGFPGDLEDYKVAPLLQPSDAVFGALLTEIVSGDGEQARPYIVIGGSAFNHVADTYTPNASYEPAFRLYEENPITNVPWTAAQINTTNWGLLLP